MPQLRLLLAIPVSLLLAPAAHAQSTPPGARVAGLDVGGLPMPEAAARVEAAFGAQLRTTLQVRAGAKRLHLTARGGELNLDAARSAQRALAGGDVPPVVTADLDGFLDRLERSVERDPRDAELRYTVTKLQVRSARDGLRLDRSAARAQIEAAIANPAGPRIIRVQLRRLEPDVTREDIARRHPTDYWWGARDCAYRGMASLLRRHAVPGDVVASVEVGTIAYWGDQRMLDLGDLVATRREQASIIFRQAE